MSKSFRKEQYVMKYTTLGKTGLQVSVVGLGGIPVQRTDEHGAVEIVNACMEHGVNYLDTARGYTISEEFFGAAIRPYREKWILATKSMSRDYEGMNADIEISLKNLQTDYIDLYQFHNYLFLRLLCFIQVQAQYSYFERLPPKRLFPSYRNGNKEEFAIDFHPQKFPYCPFDFIK